MGAVSSIQPETYRRLLSAMRRWSNVNVASEGAAFHMTTWSSTVNAHSKAFFRSCFVHSSNDWGLSTLTDVMATACLWHINHLGQNMWGGMFVFGTIERHIVPIEEFHLPLVAFLTTCQEGAKEGILVIENLWTPLDRTTHLGWTWQHSKECTKPLYYFLKPDSITANKISELIQGRTITLINELSGEEITLKM